MVHPLPDTSQVTVHTNAAGRQYAFDSQTQTSKWLKRRSSGGADDWDVFVSSKGQEYIGSPSDSVKPIWVNQIFSERKRKEACRTPSPESDDSSSKRNKTKEVASPMTNTKAAAVAPVAHDAIKPGSNDAAAADNDKKGFENKAAAKKYEGVDGTQKYSDSDAEEAKAPALAKVGRRVAPKFVIPPLT